MSLKRFKAIFLAVIILISSLYVGILIHKEHSLCLGVPLISREELQVFIEDYGLETDSIRFNGEAVPIDIYSDTLYISQPKTAFSKYYNLCGTLTSTDPELQLYFLENKALNYVYAAVKQSYPLTLIITKRGYFMKLNVIITSLPVMSITSDAEYVGAEISKDISKEGIIRLWSGYDSTIGSYSTKSSDVSWRIRGNTTSVQEKKPYKLTLKDKNGENTNMEFLGLGSDDDWILNCLTMDDTRIKEKLFMDLWNEMAAYTDYNYNMSKGEYIELIIDNEYLGLFLLQRRLDSKYFGLDEDDVIVKATDYTAETLEASYEFVTEPKNTEEVFLSLGSTYYGLNHTDYNLYNVIDTNLVLHLTAARDNFSKKNMYHILKYTDGKFENFLVPWDTDQSMGVIYRDGFKYDFNEASIGLLSTNRMETKSVMKTYPEYNELISKRCKELRNGAYSEENILSTIDRISAQIIDCGAMERDTELWGDRYYGEDTIENLRALMVTRGKLVDNYYGNY